MPTLSSPDQFQQVIAYLGLALVALLVGTAAAAIAGVAWAWQATGIIVMATAVLLGFREAVTRHSRLQIVAAVLLLVGGSYGIAVGAAGGDPFQDWTALGPVAIGVALTFFVDEQPRQPG